VTVLIVDDEESVRRTFYDWLAQGQLDCRLLVAGDAESALAHANREPIDLAILDWNLGSGSDGLQLLEDLALFHPDVVAILITGFAHQATPLSALRMGVRDYLDKNQDLSRDTFLRAVKKQVDRIVPAKQQRAFHKSLAEFRGAIEKILPLVQTTAALNEPVPLPHAISSLFRFVQRATGAQDGALLVRHFGGDIERFLAFDPSGQPRSEQLGPFANSIAATAISMQEPCVANSASELGAAVSFQPFERNRRSLLAAPLSVGSGMHVVMELFDSQKPGGFSDSDRHLAAAAAEFGGEILRHALAERQNHQVLFDAVAAALTATERMSQSTRIDVTPTAIVEPPLADTVLTQLRRGLEHNTSSVVDADAAIQLAEAVRDLAQRHGSAAVHHCVRVMRSLREMLDSLQS
jgi:ActR/RegA family two-component response regulator